LPVRQFPIFFGIWRHISRRRKWQALVLMMLTLLGSVAEIISLGSVVPFLAALTAPDRIMENSIAKRVAGVIGIFAPLDLVMPLATLFVLAALTSGALRVALLWANIRFANGLGCDLSIKLYRNILYRPYQFHLDFNWSYHNVNTVST